jgi:hypothetical protein
MNSLTRTDYIDVTSCLSPVWLTGSANAYYSSLQNAYDGAGEGDDIYSQNISFAENLFFDLNKSVTVRGGYDCDYAGRTRTTIINGDIRISDGVVTMENVRIQ